MTAGFMVTRNQNVSREVRKTGGHRPPLHKLLTVPHLQTRGNSSPLQYGNMACMVKVTFTVDEETVDTLSRLAARLKKPKSVIFREAIRDYSDRADRLSAEERDRSLAVIDRMMSRLARRDAEVAAEMHEIRAARR